MAIISAKRADASGAFIDMSISHAFIHRGELFIFHDIDIDVDISGPKYWHFKAGSSDEIAPHLEFQISTDGGALVEFFEAPTTTDDGTQLTAYNHNRRSSKTPGQLTAYYDPTVSSDGTKLSVFEIGSAGGGPNQNPGKRDRDNEFILKKDTSYLIKITVRQDNTNVSMLANFYEYNYTELTT